MLVLFVALGALVPLAVWLRGGDLFGKRVWILVGLLPFVLPAAPQLDVAIVSWGLDWPGLVNGLEVTVLDGLMVALILGMPRGRGSAVFGLLVLAYIGALLLSVLQADQPVAAAFYIWQFCRAALLLVVVSRACADGIAREHLLTGMVLGLVLEALFVLWQRLALGVVQTSGTFFHQNTLGLVTHLVLFPQVALLLAGERSGRAGVATLAGILVVVLTTSRAALLYAGIGLVLIYAVSLLRHWTLRKSLVGLGGGLVLLAMLPAVILSFEKRFEANPLTEEEYDERAAFERSAAFILRDHPLGVGANHYVYMAKNFGYSDRAGVAPFEGSRNNIVHNVYWLTASETGYLGLVAFALMLAYPLVAALSVGWRTRGSPRGDLLIGLGIGLLMVYAHSSLEYVLISKEAQYVHAMVIGVILGMVAQEARRAAPAASAPIAGAPRPAVGA